MTSKQDKMEMGELNTPDVVHDVDKTGQLLIQFRANFFENRVANKMEQPSNSSGPST